MARLNRWTVVIIVVVSLLLSTQLLRRRHDADGTIIPSEWQDWVASRWKGGEQKVTDEQPEPQQAEEEISKELDPSPTESVVPAMTETPLPLPATTPAEISSSPVDEELHPSPPTVEHKPSPKPKKPTPASKLRASPTAAYEILETQVPPPEDFDPVSQMFDLNGPPEHDPAGPRPDQIVILTATDGNGHNAAVQNIVDMALHNRREYCAHHGYINHFVNMSRIDVPAHPVWKKLPAIIETFQTYPDALWVWWLDLDAIIMTLDYKIEEQILSDAALAKILLKGEEFKKSQEEGLGIFTPKKPDVRKADLLIAQDQSTMNAGSFMLRRSEWTRMMLDVWRDPLFMDHGWPMQEQDALIHITRTNPEIRSHVGLVDARILNEYKFTFVPGDLVVHFAGCWVEDQCTENWEEMWKMRYGTLDWPLPDPLVAAKSDVGSDVVKRRPKRRVRKGEMSAMEQIARGWYG